MHFAVAIFTKPEGKTVEELLEPFEEESEEYSKFVELDPEEMEIYKKGVEKANKAGDKVTLEEVIANDGYEQNEEGKFGYYTNPNAQFDWYQIGGRWSNQLLTKDGRRCNFAALKDINWEAMFATKEQNLKKIWNETKDFERTLHGILKDETEEDFVNRNKYNFVYSVLIPNGNWINLNDDVNFYEKYIKNTNEETILTIVDCHF